MEEKIIHREASFYAVVHFGPADNPAKMPLFMKPDGMFTANPKNAYASSCMADVEMLACKRNRELEQEGDPLAGRVLPVCVSIGTSSGMGQWPSGMAMLDGFTPGGSHSDWRSEGLIEGRPSLKKKVNCWNPLT